MALTIRLTVKSVSSSALSNDEPSIARITEGLRRSAGAPELETRVNLATNVATGWNSEPGDLWLTFGGEPTIPFAVGDNFDITITPAPAKEA